MWAHILPKHPGLVLSFASGCWLLTNTSLASESVLVSWDEPEPTGAGCVERQAVMNSVEQTLGRTVFTTKDKSDVELRVSEESRVPQREAEPQTLPEWIYRAELALSDRQGRSLGKRRLSAQSCQELTETAALVLSLMVDFGAEEVDDKARAAAEQEPESPPPLPEEKPKPAPEPPVVKPPVDPEPIEPPPAVERRPLVSAFEAVARGLGGSGMRPGFALGVGAGVGFELDGWFFAEAAGGYWPAAAFSTSGGQVDVEAWELALQLCPWQLQARWFALRPCVSTRATHATATASGFSRNSSDAGLGVFVGPRALFYANVEPLFFRVEAAAEAAARRYRFTVLQEQSMSAGALYEVDPVVVQLALGVGIRL